MMASVSAGSFLAVRSTSIPSASGIFRSVRTMSKRFCSSLSIPEEPESAVCTSHPSVRKRSSRKARTWISSSTIRILLCEGIFTGYFLLTAHRIAAPPAPRMRTRDATSSRRNRDRGVCAGGALPPPSPPRADRPPRRADRVFGPLQGLVPHVDVGQPFPRDPEAGGEPGGGRGGCGEGVKGRVT